MEDVRGQLSVGILADVLRHAAFLRETGRVDASSERNRGWIVVREGRPVHAVCRRPDGSSAHGLEALAAMLSWSEGSYAFEVELPGSARDTGSVPADAFLDADDDPRTLSGDAETVLKEARAYSGHRNGKLSHLRPRIAQISSAGSGRHVAAPVGGRTTDPGPRVHGSLDAADDVRTGPAADPFGEGLGADASPHDGRAAVGGSRDGSDSFAAAVRPGAGEAVAAPEAVRLRATSVLTRVEGGDPEPRVAVSRGALDLWRHLDGATPLGAWSEQLGQDGAVLARRADELVRAGLAVVEPEPVYGHAFVSGLTDALNEIMGPMGEIVVQDALAELQLDPGDIPVDRVDDVSSALTAHLHRSDWQLKLRARVARLRVETMETRAEASP